MDKVSLAAAVIVAVFTVGPLTDPAKAETAPMPARAVDYSFAFHDAEISKVAEEILGRALGATYTVDPAVTGKMSFGIDRRLTGPQLLEAFEAALESSDIVIVRQGDSFVVEPRARAKSSSGLRGSSQSPHGPGYQSVTVPLAYATPSEVAKALQSIAPTDMVVYVDDKRGILILGGSEQELQSAIELVHTFDRSGLEDTKIRFFELNVAPAETVAGDLNRVIEASGVSGVTVIPLRRLNGLFILARTAKALSEIGVWVSRFDTASKEQGASLWVYRPRNVTATALANALSSVLGIQSPQDTSGSSTGTLGSAAPISSSLAAAGATSRNFFAQSPGGGAVSGSSGPSLASSPSGMAQTGAEDGTRVGVDKESNTLLLLAPPARWVQIQRILQEIDRAPSQVMIEASILEVTLTDQLSLGVDWNVIGAGGALGVSSINATSGTIAATTPGFSVAYLASDIKAAIHALGAKTNVQVISAPKVLALDNHVARLDVGDQVPIVTQSSQSVVGASSPVINSVDYRDTGVILSVTPRIGEGDRIMLDVDQEVSSVIQTTTSGINSPTIQQRKIATSLVLENGGLVALGGLISSNRSRSDTGFPVLKDIPILGNLLKTQTGNNTRTELIVLLTAHVMRDAATSHRVMTDLLADMHEISRSGLVKP